ncbi:MAG: putative molybdopterin biosynthesis protein [Herbinix sp.]|nr:putative molybdopterin biosynthesis protein [Herbinix sp.]
MKLIKTTEAVGHVLCHDLTQIIKGVTKDARFRKGHIVTEEDIPVLLSMGKEHLYLWEKTEDMLHENEGAVILYDICKNDYMRPSEIKEGKIDIFATTEGLFKVDKERLKRINSLGELMIATRHGNFPVKEGEHLAGTRVIPLLIDKDKMNRAKEAAGDTPLMQIKPFHHKKVGIITTGNEVFYGRIQDAFGPVLRQKVSEYPSEVIGQRILSDDPKSITVL